MKKHLQRKWRSFFALMIGFCLTLAGLPALSHGNSLILTAHASDWTSWLWGDEDEDATVWSSDDADDDSTVWSSDDADDDSTVWSSDDDDSKKSRKTDAADDSSSDTEDITQIDVDEDETYTSKLEVAAYIYQFGHLPDNFIKKNKAKKLGWVSSEGNLDEVAPGKSIGGDYFGNYEGLLPEEDGRDYYECDIDYTGGFRGSKRIIYSSDGLIYYTEDHYKTFEELYGGE